ncbi:MAG: acyltransferase [Thermoguttaceae bacterium]
MGGASAKGQPRDIMSSVPKDFVMPTDGTIDHTLTTGKVQSAGSEAPSPSASKHAAPTDWRESGRVPCLDGMRALAISLVIMSHFSGPLPIIWRLPEYLVDGHLGVVCFFVISGFLITLLLLREHERHGSVSLKKFYVRRALRILPAYVVYLSAIGVLQYAGFLHYSSLYWLAALTYTMCFTNRNAWSLGHTWSLSVEEHYYLIWPLVVKAFKPALAVRCVIFYLLVTPLIRVVLHRFTPRLDDIEFWSPTQMANIGAGCLLAFVVKGYAFQSAYDALRQKPYRALLIGILILLCSRAVYFVEYIRIPFGDPIDSAGFAMVIFGLLHLNERSVVSRLFNCRPAVWVGILSYSLYLWQQPFADGRLTRSALRWQWNMLSILVAATMSYTLVERPFLRLKTRFS